MQRMILIGLAVFGLTLFVATAAEADYATEVAADSPVAWWRLNETSGTTVANSGLTAGYGGTAMLNTNLNIIGPANSAAALSFDPEAEIPKGDYIFVPESGGFDSLDFGVGDSITIEAWVDLKELTQPTIMGRDAPYILSKGRLNYASATDQEYDLRLSIWDDTVGGGTSSPTIRVDFLGRNADDDTWHKWHSYAGFELNSGWHHVALSYTFGNGGTMKGYVDGVGDNGTWTRGDGNFTPYQDEEDIWLGSAQNGADYATVHGSIDEVAVYRSTLSAARIQAHYEAGEIPVIVPGDANTDGIVDDMDAATLAENWLVGDADWGMGDFNGDYIVDDRDATLLAANWQNGVVATGAVPEPGTVALLLGLFAGMFCLLRRQGV